MTDKVLEKLENAYRQSVALKAVHIEKGWWHTGGPKDWPEETDEQEAERRAKREFDYAVDVIGVTRKEALAALTVADAKYYHEGSFKLGTKEYDLLITPRDKYEERGIATELEGHVRVLWE